MHPQLKKVCKCPPTLDNVCSCKGSRRANCRDVAEVYDLLTKDGCKKPAEWKKPVPLKFQGKVYKPRHFKDTCVPMTPSMHTRLHYITHCANEPLKPSCGVCGSRRDEAPESEYTSSSSDDAASGILKCSGRKGRRAAMGRVKRVRYFDLLPGDVMMPMPQPYVMHGAPNVNQNMIDVPSPKTSGDLAPAERAEVRLNERVPPMPSKAGYKVFGPHSGIFINTQPHFTPDYDVPTGHEKILPRRRRKKRKIKPFVKGQCGNKTCRAKRCLKYGPTRKKGGSRSSRRRVRRDTGECPDDDIPKPQHVIAPNLRKGTLQTHSLTVLNCNKERKNSPQYGILIGNVNMCDQKYSNKSRGKQGMVVSVMAYCLAFHYHPKQWTMKLIDNLIDAADQWYLELADKVHDHAAVYGMCEVLPFARKQTLNLNGKKMQILVGEPEIVGYTMTLDPTIYNLCRGLKAFFVENRAGVLMTRVLKIVIWRDRVCFYIFDGAGRDKRACSKFANSGAALMNVKDLSTLADVLLARTIVEDQKFVLAPLKVTKMLDENADEDFESDVELTQAEKAMLGYRILNENCAVVNANMHLGDKSFEDAKFRQALPVAVVALTYAKVSPPNTWHSKTLDKILRLGNKLYLQCRPPKVLIDLTIDNIPNEICIGPYACEIIIYRERVKGQLFTPKECINDIKRGLDDFFSREYNSGIIEFNNYHLAVWRQKEMYYLFDPYPRTSEGTRTAQGGKACCVMLLNPESVYQVFLKNWDYMPLTTLFVIHGFKVLKLKKKDPKMKLVCTLSDEDLPGARKKVKRQVLAAAQGRGDFQKEIFHDTSPNEHVKGPAVQGPGCQMDEEKLGDIISLVDSIQEEYLTPIPLRYKNMAPDPMELRAVNLDSPTCSVTQVIPPWPKTRDKTNEPPDPDPDPEPSPPPTPPPPPEGGGEEAEDEEDAEDEETARLKAEEDARRKAEEEEARRKALELPPPLPPPPPSPQLEPELAPLPVQMIEDEIQIIEPADVDRRVLLTEDATKRYKMRQLRNKQQLPLSEKKPDITPSQEIKNPYNFVTLPDLSQIVRGGAAIKNEKAQEMMPFAAIMAIVTSYKYTISTWTSGIVTFVIDTAGTLYKQKTDRFQFAPVHIIPRIKIGNQVYQAVIDVVGEGATWQLEDILERKFFKRFDRGMVTTCNYSGAIFARNGLYYLFDASPCSAMGLRQDNGRGNACFIRFRNIHDLVTRILYNKDGRKEDQQFILSHILVRRLMTEPRMKLPEDYDYVAMKPKSTRSKPTLIASGTETKRKPTDLVKAESDVQVGYQEVNGTFRIEGTTHLSDTFSGSGVNACHFVCLVTMLLATMHPVMTWDPIMVDTCIEKGLEIYAKSTNRTICEKRAIKNIILDGKFINVNIKKILVVNENPGKTVEQYMNAVLARLRYVIVWYPSANFVVCQSDGFYHLFDPYSRGAVKSDSTSVSKTSSATSVTSEASTSSKGSEASKGTPSRKDSSASKGSLSRNSSSASNSSTQKKASTSRSNLTADNKSSVSSLGKKVKESSKISKSSKKPEGKKSTVHANWTLYRSVDSLIKKLKSIVPSGQVNTPEFYTFELTSVKNAPKYSILNCKLCPLFKPEANPNAPYTKRRKVPPLVDEKMYWLLSGTVPWSRMSPVNEMGLERRTPKSVWNDWEIEMPGDLYSLWGSMHPLDEHFDEPCRGKQYLATCVVALALTQKCELKAWSGSLLDGIVIVGDKYYSQSSGKKSCAPKTELTLDHLSSTFTEMYPYSFSVKFKHVLFGFVYNILPDRFNLSRAVIYFFEKNNLGILISCTKNIAFGKAGSSFFMYDCQSYGMPVFSPGTGASYMLKCESLNRLIYCMVLTLNLKRHGQQFNLYSAQYIISEMK